jgi:Domain of unknown function (DUF4258)
MLTPIHIASTVAHVRGQLYHVLVAGKMVSIVLTFHALERIAQWRLTVAGVLQTILFPEEVLRGHRGRFIAHRRVQTHVVRVIYEYTERIPVVITVYYPSAKRYFQGHEVYEDHLLS